MKIKLLLLICSCVVACFFGACKTTQDNSSSSFHSVEVKSRASKQQLADFFSLEGYTTLESNALHEIRGIEDVVYSGDQLFVLDNATDFQNIWSFSLTGNYTGSIGHYSETQVEGYGGLNDICLSNMGDEIIGLDAGKLSFKRYGLQGDLRSILPNGMYGENVELLRSGNYVVYNEYGASDISKRFHLVFYDEKGNLTKRLVPYDEKFEGMAYEFTGFLSRSSGSLWFSPPFNDTIYTVSEKGITPEYYFDFGSLSIPSHLREDKIDGWDVDNFAYIMSSFVKLGNLSIFEYYAEQRLNFGLYDDKTGLFLRFDDAKRDEYSELLRVGKIYPKDNQSFALVLDTKRIKYLTQKGIINFEYFKANHPRFLEDLHAAASKERAFMVLHLSVKPGASVE